MTDGNKKSEKKIFFGGILIGIILGISGNLAISSIFEVIHFLNWDKSSLYLETLIAIIIATILITGYVSYISWEKLSED